MDGCLYLILIVVLVTVVASLIFGPMPGLVIGGIVATIMALQLFA